MSIVFTPKTTNEKVQLGFDFSKALAATETITSADVEISILTGTDPYPYAVLLGSPATGGKLVRQWVQDGVAGAIYEISVTATSSLGQVLELQGILEIKTDIEEYSLLYAKSKILQSLKTDRLVLAVSNAFSDFPVTDSYLFGKIKTAEGILERRLKINLTPTKFVTRNTDTAITDNYTSNGIRWAYDDNYDYPYGAFADESWFWTNLRNHPIISVESIKFSFPPPLSNSVFEIPSSWIVIDHNNSSIQLVPSTASFSSYLPPYIFNILGGGRQMPYLVYINYTAGLANAFAQYPEMDDLIQKIAVHSLIEDSYPTTGGSISADGLSQYQNFNIKQFEAIIDKRIETLRQSISGIRMVIL